MKKIGLCLSLLMLSFVAFAQQDTTMVYSSPGYSNDPIRSKWYSKVQFKDNLYVLSLFDKKDVLQEQISYADIKLEVRQGAYSYYANNVEVVHGSYDKGHKNGEWNLYYPNRKLKETLNYAWGKLNGLYVSYWENGHVENKGVYKGGNKVEVWHLHYSDCTLAYRERFDENGNWVEGEYFGANQEKVNKESVVKAPSYPGGLLAFEKEISKKLKYPAEVREKGIKGVVELNCLVLANGSLEDIRIVSSPQDVMTKAALNVLKYLKPWHSGKELGVPVNMRHQFEIKF